MQVQDERLLRLCAYVPLTGVQLEVNELNQTRMLVFSNYVLEEALCFDERMTWSCAPAEMTFDALVEISIHVMTHSLIGLRMWAMCVLRSACLTGWITADLLLRRGISEEDVHSIIL